MRGLDLGIAVGSLALLLVVYLLTPPGTDSSSLGLVVAMMIGAHLVVLGAIATAPTVPLFGGRAIAMAGVAYWFLLEIATTGGAYDLFRADHVLYGLVLVQIFTVSFLAAHTFFLRRPRRETSLLARLTPAPRTPTGWTFAVLAGGVLGLMPIIVYGGSDLGAILEGILASRSGNIGWGRTNLGDERSPILAMSYFGWATAGLAGVFVWRMRGWIGHRAAVAMVGGGFVLLHFFGGTRHLLAILVLPVLGFIYLAAPPERRRRTAFLLAAGLVTAYAAFQVQHYARTRGFRNIDTERLVLELQRPRGHEHFVEVLHVTDLVPRTIDYEMPGSVLFHVVVNPIPRALWPGKPVDRFWREYASIRAGSDVMSGGTTLSYSNIGQFYVEGGLAMVIACGIFFAWWAALADDLARRGGTRPELLYLACLMMVLMLLAFRGVSAGILYVVPAAVILLGIGRVAEVVLDARTAWPAYWWTPAPLAYLAAPSAPHVQSPLMPQYPAPPMPPPVHDRLRQ